MIAYTPYLRRGDLALNAILFRRDLLGERSFARSQRQVRGNSSSTLNLLGHDAEAVARSIYGDASLAPLVAKDNSLFGLYLNCLSTLDQRAFEEGVPDRVGYITSYRLSHGAKACTLAALFLRSCRDCVREDLESQGYSAWRVVHQVPSLFHCPRHESALIEWRNYPGAVPGYIGGLPTPNDPKVIDQEFVERIDPSDGYSSYLRLWKRLSEEGIEQLAIDRWVPLVDASANASGGVPALVSLVEDSIKRRWNLGSVFVGRLLRIERNLSIEDELSLSTQPKNLARRMLVLDSLLDLGLVCAARDFPLQQNLSLVQSANSVQSRTDQEVATSELLNIAFRLHVKPSIALALLKQRELKDTIRHFGDASLRQAKPTIRACSDELLETISRSLSSPGFNWADKTLARRRKKAVAK